MTSTGDSALQGSDVKHVLVVLVLVVSAVLRQLLRKFKCFWLLLIKKGIAVTDFAQSLTQRIYFVKLWFLVQLRVDIDQRSGLDGFTTDFVGFHMFLILSETSFSTLHLLHMGMRSLHLLRHDRVH